MSGAAIAGMDKWEILNSHYCYYITQNNNKGTKGRDTPCCGLDWALVSPVI